MARGILRQSDNDLDLAIQGGGFLVLKEGERTFYARTGSFAVDKDGYIILQGTDYQLASLGADGRTSAFQLQDKRTDPPVATTSIGFADNLSSTATEATVSDIAVYDSTGVKQVWQVKLQPQTSGLPGQWSVAVLDQTGRTVGTSTLKFIGGIIDPTTAKLIISDSPAGAAPLVVELDFSTGVTSFSSGALSTLRASAIDGNGSGALSSVTVDDVGQVKLTYSNGETAQIGAIALADFQDPQQLDRFGQGLYIEKRDADRRLMTSGSDGIGKIVSRQVEASNVDLSQEFGDLILIQRGFQAASQVVSVSNDMIQQLFGMRGQG